MTSINPNLINTGYVSTTNNNNVNTQPTNTTETVTTGVPVETKDVSEKDTFAYMSGAAAYNKANVTFSTQALVNKYNSPEAIARISAMMGDFEEGVVAGLAKFEEEIGAMFQGLSEGDKMALAAEYFASQTP